MAHSPLETRRNTAWALVVSALVAAGFVVWIAAPVMAEDVVRVANPTSAKGYVEWRGRVVDYSGGGLEIELAGGLQRSFPADQVVRVQTQYTARHVEADARFARGEFASAAALYGEARNTETRPWVRRRITAQLVWCHRGLGNLELAGGEFLLLVRDDPNTPYFACIPLTWIPSEPTVNLQRAAGEWLRRDEMPAAVLLGASHLILTSGGSHRAALEKLNGLATNPDPKIAFLALAQTWRTTAITADEDRLRRWRDTIERMPEPLRAGPYYVLGRARAHRQQWDAAALAWLRVPILYPEHRRLAAQSLWDAGRSLEQLGQPEPSGRLYQELVARYPNAPSAAEARKRLGGSE